MNLLLETHTLVWLMQSNTKLSRLANILIADPANILHLRKASVWEIGIKSGTRKLGLTVPYQTFMKTAIRGYGLIVLPITTEDCIHYEALGFPDPQHRDPFDRMIITHAQRNSLDILGVDVAFDAYGATRLW